MTQSKYEYFLDLIRKAIIKENNMYDIKLIKLVLKIRNYVCKRALKRINKKSVQNLHEYNTRHTTATRMAENLRKYELSTEIQYTSQDNAINCLYNEVVELVSK